VGSDDSVSLVGAATSYSGDLSPAFGTVDSEEKKKEDGDAEQ
jgi:hypothetical protein